VYNFEFFKASLYLLIKKLLIPIAIMSRNIKKNKARIFPFLKSSMYYILKYKNCVLIMHYSTFPPQPQIYVLKMLSLTINLNKRIIDLCVCVITYVDIYYCVRKNYLSSAKFFVSFLFTDRQPKFRQHLLTLNYCYKYHVFD